MTTGEKIAVLRRRAGLSQETLAEELGISRQAVSRWETGESLPDTEKIIRLSRLFGVSTDYLLLEDTPEAAPSLQSTSSPAVPLLRWIPRLNSGLAATGAALSLLGVLSAALWALRLDQWRSGFGRFGTALIFHWPGELLLAGVTLLLLSLLLRRLFPVK